MKKSKKYNLFKKAIWDSFTVEYCPFCDTEQVIWSEGVTACPNCGASLAPCSMCNDCNYATCPYGCDGTENDANKPITAPPISLMESEVLYKYL